MSFTSTPSPREAPHDEHDRHLFPCRPAARRGRPAMVRPSHRLARRPRNLGLDRPDGHGLRPGLAPGPRRPRLHDLEQAHVRTPPTPRLARGGLRLAHGPGRRVARRPHRDAPFGQRRLRCLQGRHAAPPRDEQRAFEEFLGRLREAKDKAEFDQFMDDRARRARGRPPSDDATARPTARAAPARPGSRACGRGGGPPPFLHPARRPPMSATAPALHGLPDPVREPDFYAGVTSSAGSPGW
jgi:hypothetical protein